VLSLVALAVAASAFVKGSIGFGFPTLGTPLLALIVDVKTAFLVLIVPNIVMDGLQLARAGAPGATARRLASLVACGAVGTVLGTRLLAGFSPRTVMLILGGFIVTFVVLSVLRLSPRLPPHWEPWASPVVGFVAGIVGGITNVPGTPLVLYYYALGLSKREFVSVVRPDDVGAAGLVTRPDPGRPRRLRPRPPRPGPPRPPNLQPGRPHLPRPPRHLADVPEPLIEETSAAAGYR
jgi:uncharacterized membrane protein YfcA